jgi:hypothetical protein
LVDDAAQSIAWKLRTLFTPAMTQPTCHKSSAWRAMPDKSGYRVRELNSWPVIADEIVVIEIVDNRM